MWCVHVIVNYLISCEMSICRYRGVTTLHRHDVLLHQLPRLAGRSHHHSVLRSVSNKVGV